MNRKRSGFSLVLSLAIMAGMVMLVIVLAAFLQVETRLALGHSGYMRARLNAIASAKMALGQLQQLAGPDQRVTMRADMYDAGKAPSAQYSTTVTTAENPSAPSSGKLSHQKRFWTGVWATGGISQNRVRDWNVAKPHDTRLFLGWLCSPGVISSDPEIADVSKLPNNMPSGSSMYNNNASPYPPATSIVDTLGKALIDDLGNPLSNTPDTVLVPLLSRGSVKMTTNTPSRWAVEYSGAVDAMPMPLPGPNSGSNTVKYGVNGRYAFWVGDEGVKAKANIPDVYGITTGGSNFKGGLTIWDEGFRGSGAQRSALEAIIPADKLDYTGGAILTNAWKFSTWRDADIAISNSWDTSYMSRVRSPNDLALWANNVSGTAAGDAMRDAAKVLWHDVTPWSYSTITDTYNGGIKSDLSTAFELPYIVYRGLEMFYGQKNSTDSYIKKASLFHDADFAAIGGATGAIGQPGAVDFNRPNLLDVDFGDAVTLIKSSPRASEWAPSYTSSILGSSYSTLLIQNASEVPERMGFVYELPLRSAFYGGKVNRNQSITANLNNYLERGPTWDLYRNYYRMYKLEIEACTQKLLIQNQPATSSGAVFARGAEPLSYATGKLGSNSKGLNSGFYPYGFKTGETNGAQSTSKAAFRYNLRTHEGAQYLRHQLASEKTDYYPNGKIPPLTWQTSMKVSPSILRLAFIYSAVWTDEHIGIAIDPIIVVHNPYDCAIEFSGISMVSTEADLSHIFDFYYQKAGKGLIQIGDAYPSSTWEQKHQITFRAVAGSSGTTSSGTNSKVFRLEPGEVKVISATTDKLKSLDTYGNIDLPCDFVYNQSSTLFLPMEPYAVNATSNNGMKYFDGATTIQLDPLISSTAHPSKIRLFSNSQSKSNPAISNLTVLQNVIDNLKNTDGTTWDGSVNQLNTITGGTGICIKARNQDGTNFKVKNPPQVILQTPQYDKNGLLLSTRNNKVRGNVHIANGGYQEYNFYLQYDTSPRGEPLSAFRHWGGPVDQAAELLIDGSRSLNSDTVNEPLILSLKTITAGWPLYGNDASNYDNWGDQSKPQSNFIGDAEFTTTDSGIGFNYQIVGGTPPISRTMPDILGGISLGPITNLTAGPWPTISKAGSTKILDGKRPFFVSDFFVRGASECKTENVKNIYYNVVSSYKNALGTIEASGANFPIEIMPAPITPFALSTRAQNANHLGYDGKAAAPIGWISSQRIISNGDVISFASGSGNNAFWGSSIKPLGSTDPMPVILFSIPRRPLLSLSQLGSAATSEVSTDPDLTVGSSFAHPGIKDLSKLTEWPGTKSPADNYDPPVPENGYVSKITGVSGTDPNINLGKILRGIASVRSDAAFASNLALWDSYWFSGLNTQAKSYSDSATDWPGGPNLPTDSAILGAQATALGLNGVTDLATLNGIKAALDKGYNPLANKRVAYRPDTSLPTTTTVSTVGMQPDSVTTANRIFPDYLTFPHPTFLGRRSLYDGGFNVNSTSKAAWKAILASLRKQKLPEGSAQADGTPLTRFARAFGDKFDTKSNTSSPWNTYRELTDSEIDDLAGAVVSEVRKRGPFMSLSDFINRRLINDDNFGLKGALQAAIDATAINDAAIDAAGGTFATEKGVKPDSPPYLPIDPNDRFPSARAMSNKNFNNSDQKIVAGLGAPGIISQMDVLNSVGPNLTARSDTFVIRAYGEAFDNNGNSIGKAWIEVVAQRSTDFLAFTDQAAQSIKVSAEPTVRDQTYRNNDGTSKSDYDTKPILDKYRRNNKANSPTMATSTEQLINLNRILGRRFNAVSLRWLNPQDI